MATVRRLPYSDTLLDHISDIANWSSPLFCNIHSFSRTPFEIHVNATPFPARAGHNPNDHLKDNLAQMEVPHVEPLFLQCMALFQLARDMHWTFIDFSRLHLRPGFLPLFPLALSENSFQDSPERLLELFRGNPRFTELNTGNWEDRFQRLMKKYTFEESRVHLYRLEDLATAILNAYPPDEMERDANLKININTPGAYLREMIREHIIANQVSAPVFLAHLGRSSGQLPHVLARLLDAPDAYKDGDYVSLIRHLERFIAQSPFSSILMMVETPRHGDAEFLDYLVNVSGVRGIRLICFDGPGALEFDLELNEKPVNLLGKYLRFGEPGQDKTNLSISSGEKPGSSGGFPVDLVKAGQWEKIKNRLMEQQRRKKAAEFFFPNAESLLAPHVDTLKADMDLTGLLVNQLADAGDFISAGFLLAATDCLTPAAQPDLPPALQMDIGRVYLERKEYKELRRVLSGLKEEDLKEPDVYHYLWFTLHHRESQHEKAETHRKKIHSYLYRHRAALERYDRLIYKGDYDAAEAGLTKALNYFSRRGNEKDRIETQALMAKLCREKGSYDEAEKMYKNIFIRGQIKNFHLLSARLCVDLGNLFHRSDLFKTAETWYRRALKLFRAQKNRNGILLATFNLTHTDRVNGNWRETKQFLEDILKADGESGSKAAMAVDYYNIGHLEYLKLRTDGCREFVETAIALFKEQGHYNPLVDCELLKLKARLTGGESRAVDRAALKDLKKYCAQTALGKNQRAAVSVMETVYADAAGKRGATALEKVSLMESTSQQFELLAALLRRYRDKAMLDRLKELSMALSSSSRNYYYYEYYYIYYAYFFETGSSSAISAEESRRFHDVYYFFLRNQRLVPVEITKVKAEIDRRESSYEVFENARLVDHYKQWKLPADFFDALITELKKLTPVELVRLIIFPDQNHGSEPAFDFTSRGGSIRGFKRLTRQLIKEAMVSAEHLNLDLADIRKRCDCDERVFYLFGNTRVILWKISPQLFGGLLLAFRDGERGEEDLYARHEPFFNKFGALIRGFVEGDYKIHRKLAFLIGQSPAMQNLKERILRVGKVDFSVLIRGESGTGKELVAKGVHLLSNRASGPFVPVNAAAIPDNLLEAELFGYKKGAFTGAGESKTGLIQAAHGGTLFLDEVADLPLNLQAKLLRVLQEGEIRRLGENKTVAVDVRLVTATNKNLKAMIEAGTFRQDLYFRFQDLIINVPPLRDREQDIPLLVEHFLKKYKFEIPGEDELRRICSHFQGRYWSGNVRELESGVKRVITYYPDFEGDAEETGDIDTGLIAARDRMERNMLYAALEESDWNKAEAARALKITRQYLFKLVNKHKLEDR